MARPYDRKRSIRSAAASNGVRSTGPVEHGSQTPGWDWLSTPQPTDAGGDAKTPTQRLRYAILRDPASQERLLLSMSYEDGLPVRSIPYMLSDSERETAARVMVLTRRPQDSFFRIEGRLGRSALEALAGFRVKGPDGRDMTFSEPIEGRDQWESDENGVQTFRLVDGDQTRLVEAGGPCLLENDRLTPIVTTLPDDLALRLARSGPLAPETSLLVRSRLEQVAPHAAPKAVVIRRRPATPLATVTLDRDGDVPVARIGASYDGMAVKDVGKGGELRSYDPETGILDVVERNHEAERDILQDASMLGLEKTADPTIRRYAGNDPVVHAAVHTAENRDRIEAAGWNVVESPRWNISLEPISHLELRIALGTDEPGTFLLDVVGDGQIVDFIDPLTRIALTVPDDADDAEAEAILSDLVHDDRAFVGSDDGRVWTMPGHEFVSLLVSLRRILIAPRNRAEPLRADLYSIADLAALSEDVGLGAPESVERLLVAMRGEIDRMVEWPSCFVGERDQRQLHAAAWMRTLFDHGYGGILADDVGFGKTIEFCLHIASLHEQGLLADGAVIAAPNRAVPSLMQKIATNFPGLPLVAWHGSKRPEVGRGDIVLTSHDLFKRTSCPLNKRAWTVAVLDEAQDARKPNGHLAVAFGALEAHQKIPTTASPIENSLEDLWTLMNIANKGLLGDIVQFRRMVVNPILKDADVNVVNRVNAITAPFQLKRIDAERPVPTIEDVVVRLSSEQRLQYDAQIAMARAKHQSRIDKARESGVGANALGMSIFMSLTRVRQVCCSPLLMPGGVGGPVSPYAVSPKTAAMVDMGGEFVSRGERGIVFSSWTGHLDILAVAMRAVGIRVAQYDGRMSIKECLAAEDAFRAGEVDMLLMTTKAGGRSLDFNEADFVFFGDPWWNPKVERQAIGRTTRRGQTKTIRVYRFLTASPIEDRIMKIHHAKDRLSDIITPGRMIEAVEGITLEDIDELLTTFAEYDEELRLAA